MMKFKNLFQKRILIPLALLGAFGAYTAETYIAFPTYPASDHYDAASGQFHNNPPSRAVAKVGLTAALWKMVFHERAMHPPRALPMQTPDWQAFFKPSEQAKFVWFGHSTLFVRLNGKTILIDPVYDNTPSPVGLMMHRFQPPPVALADLPPIDVVVYSHAHYDHLDSKVVEYFAQNQPNIQFITPLGVGEYLKKWGIAPHNIRELDWWQSVDLFGTTFHAVPARHDASRSLYDKNKSLWAGWVLQTPIEKIYYSGDSSYSPNFAEIGRRLGGFDWVFMENGQYNQPWEDSHMFPAQTIQAVLDVKSKRFVPVHWAAYPLSVHGWDESVRESAKIAAEKNVPMVTPIMGQVFDAQTQTEKWWEKVQ